ncbi:MAG: LEA type 2 family protein, partial [Alistipes sp.]|nr:LEA type 2 family protein [Alistipes sp.]
MRRLLLLLLLTTLVGCGAAEPPRIQGVEVEPVWKGVATVEEYPERVVVKVTVENPSAAVKLLGGRARIGYGGRWVAMLTLTEKVKIPARGSATVELPLRLNVQRTT